jgi:hypothetical protein
MHLKHIIKKTFSDSLWEDRGLYPIYLYLVLKRKNFYPFFFVHLSLTTQTIESAVSRMSRCTYDQCSYELEQLASSDDGYEIRFQDALARTIYILYVTRIHELCLYELEHLASTDNT